MCASVCVSDFFLWGQQGDDDPKLYVVITKQQQDFLKYSFLFFVLYSSSVCSLFHSFNHGKKVEGKMQIVNSNVI